MIAGRIEALLHEAPVVDGHNDLPWSHRILARNDFGALDVGHDTTAAGLHTDLPRLRRGGVGAQFWSVWVPVEAGYRVAVTAKELGEEEAGQDSRAAGVEARPGVPIEELLSKDRVARKRSRGDCDGRTRHRGPQV